MALRPTFCGLPKLAPLPYDRLNYTTYTQHSLHKHVPIWEEARMRRSRQAAVVRRSTPII